MTRSIYKFALGAAVAVLITPAAIAGVESDDPIVIVQNNWTSQLVLSNVVGLALEDMGYTVEYAPSDTQLQFTAIANGDMHLQVEAWEGSMKPAWSGMADNWPGAWAAVQKISFTNAQIAVSALMVDVDGLSPEEAAAKWVADNPDVVASWKQR